MAKSVFSIPIFFIVFRETLEAALIVAVLLGLVDQLVHRSQPGSPILTPVADSEKNDTVSSPPSAASDSDSTLNDARTRRLLKKLRWQIFLGSLSGFLITLAIGGAFIAVWFTQASNLWAKSEDLWEAIFSLIASLIIFIMGVTMLKMDRAKAKWRVKLQHAFEGHAVDRGTRTGKYALFVLPFITVLREGMEAIIFVGGVSLGQPATAIPIAAIVGIVCGLTVGFLIYSFASKTSLSIFLVVMTNLLLLIGAGLFSRSINFFQNHAFNTLLGAQVDDLGGTGPGSYDVRGYVWHLQCCDPSAGQAWSIFGALFGWTNSATLGTVLGYVFYWLAVILTLVVLKFREGRTTLLGRESARGRERRLAREEQDGNVSV